MSSELPVVSTIVSLRSITKKRPVSKRKRIIHVRRFSPLVVFNACFVSASLGAYAVFATTCFSSRLFRFTRERAHAGMATFYSLDGANVNFRSRAFCEKISPRGFFFKSFQLARLIYSESKRLPFLYSQVIYSVESHFEYSSFAN